MRLNCFIHYSRSKQIKSKYPDVLFLFLVGISLKESGDKAVPTTSSGSGAQSCVSFSVNSALPTTSNQVLTGLNSTVSSLGLNAFTSPVFCSTAPNGLQIPQANSVIQINIFPNPRSGAYESDKSISAAADTGGNTSPQAPQSSNLEVQSRAAELKPLLEQPSRSGTYGGNSDNFAKQTSLTMSEGSELLKQDSVSNTDKVHDLLSTERLGQTQRKRLKRKSECETSSLKEFAGDALDNTEGMFCDLDSLQRPQGIELRREQNNKADNFLMTRSGNSSCVERRGRTRRREKQWFICELCSLSFSRRCRYNEHMYSHDGMHAVYIFALLSEIICN